jgi:hypothetical protein
MSFINLNVNSAKSLPDLQKERIIWTQIFGYPKFSESNSQY